MLTATACGTTTPFIADSTDAGMQPLDAGAVTHDAGMRETKFIFAFEDSISLSVTDPDGQRAAALASFFELQPSDTSILIVKFWASSIAALTPTQTFAFTPISSWSTAMRASLQPSILSHSAPTGDGRQFLLLLSEMQRVVAADIARGGSANYQVILISDSSTTNEDQALLCGNAVSGFPALDDAKNSARFSAVRVLRPKQAIPPCGDSFEQTACKITAPASMCPAGYLAADVARLTQMSALGHGVFKSFEGAAAVDYSVVVAH